MLYQRFYESRLLQMVKPNKVLVLLGARRVGKTALIKKIVQQSTEEVIFLNGDDIESHALLERQSEVNYRNLMGNCRFLVIDEAQEIPGIGKKLKLMVDTIEGLKVLITGSSAFELHDQVGEPLVGRMRTLHLFPMSQLEYSQAENAFQTHSLLEERLIFGCFPELGQMSGRTEKTDYLKELVQGYLLRDILAFEGIRKRDKIIALLQKLAYRTGTEISLEGLGKELQISKNTVEKYLDLFTKVFILYSIPGFSRNRDNEITKMKKWFFIDNGIRNALINAFQPISAREDIGQLWENYLHAERSKMLHYRGFSSQIHFWRTHSKQEIDRIELVDNEIQAFEFKWKTEKTRIPTEFQKSYPEAVFSVIHRDNYLDFVLGHSQK